MEVERSRQLVAFFPEMEVLLLSPITESVDKPSYPNFNSLFALISVSMVPEYCSHRQYWMTMYTDRGFPRFRSNYDRSRRYFVKLGWIKIDPPIYGSRSREPWIPAVQQNNKRSLILHPKQCEVSHFLSKPSESSHCFAQLGGSSLINFSQFGNFMEDS